MEPRNNEAQPSTDRDHSPPRFTKTMGIVRWALFGAITVFALVMVLSHFRIAPWTPRDTGGIQYHCPMHPEYVANQKGDCPICGMSLVPVKEKHEGEEPSTAPGGSSDVPGLVPVALEPRWIQAIGVRTGRVERRAASDELRLAGYIAVDETRTAVVSVRASGWIEALHANRTGQKVSRGEPLATLYSEDLSTAAQELVIASASYRKAGADSVLALSRRRLLEAAREKLRLLGMSSEDVARIETSGEARPQYVLRSPVAGVVLEKNVVEGQFVTPEEPLFRIADLGTIWVLADVYEKDIASATVGSPARLSVDAFPGEIFEGKVGFVYPSVSETSRTLKVRIEFSNPSLRLRPGMFAEVTLAPRGGETIAVPAEAVMDGGKTRYVFVVRDEARFEPRLVVTGRRFDGWIEVLSGLEIGEEVVTSANFLIDSESRLRAAVARMGDGGREPQREPVSKPEPNHRH